MARYLHLLVQDGEFRLDTSFGPPDVDPYTSALAADLTDGCLAVVADANPHSAQAIREALKADPTFLPIDPWFKE